MPTLISKEQIEEIRARSDVVDVIGTYVQLKRGGSSLKGLCPFHKEKTPSFHVNPQRQIFHCFGCDKGGDVFRFIMEYENVDFPTAARLLADKCGLRLELSDSPGGPSGPSKDKLLRVLDEAAAFYRRILETSAVAAGARAYLEERAMDPGMSEQFRVGYAPNRRGTLETWAKKYEFDTELLVATGLLARAEDSGQIYERFRDRLMFPICDEMGRVVGFSGRIMQKDARVAKYVNSPETALFRKNRILFALDRARKDILEAREAIVCEGQIDVIRCHEAGFTTAIAAQGTAFTEAHARMVKRYADSAVLVLDSDRAGQDAAIRAAEVLLAEGLSVRAAALPEGDDPDTLIVQQGAEAFGDLVKNAQSIVDFEIDILSGREEPGSEAGAMRVTRAVLATVAKVPEQTRQERLLRQASARLGVSEGALRQDLRRARRSQPRARNEPEAPARPQAPVSHPGEEVALAELLAADPEVTGLVRDFLPLEHVTDPYCRTMVAALLEGRDLQSGLEPAAGDDPLDEDALQRLASGVVMAPVRVVGEDRNHADAVKDIILTLRRKAVERQRRDLQRRMAAASEADRPGLEAECRQSTLDISLFRAGWEQALPLLEGL